MVSDDLSGHEPNSLISNKIGVVYTISRPLLPPPSIIDELFLGRRFFILTSALQKVGLGDWLSWGWKKKKDHDTEKGATVTFFAPSDYAFRRLPPRLRRFLFSPFGAKALKKILSYHIVPDIILYTGNAVTLCRERSANNPRQTISTIPQRRRRTNFAKYLNGTKKSSMILLLWPSDLRSWETSASRGTKLRKILKRGLSVFFQTETVNLASASQLPVDSPAGDANSTANPGRLEKRMRYPVI